MVNNIRIVFMGATNFSAEILSMLLEQDYKVEAIFTIPQEFKISYSPNKVKSFTYADLRTIAPAGVPVYEVNGEQGNQLPDYRGVIASIKPSVILVMGWYYMVPKSIRTLAKHGAWGIHASLLPAYAGGAPLVWAMINGEKETGVTLFRLDDGVDDGDIIAQSTFHIEFEDTIREVYAKATQASKLILLDALAHIDKVSYKPQDKSKLRVFPQRKPEDGAIDLQQSAVELYNFIRAQSSPYPGAFIRTSDGKKLIIEKARIEE